MVDEAPTAGDAAPSRIDRRTLLTTGAATAIVGAGLGAGAVALLRSPGRGPTLWTRPDHSGSQPVGGLHLQFGSDASTEVVVSWHTTDPVRNPRVMVGTPTSGFGRVAQAETRTYRDAKSKTEVRVHHARLDNLTPDIDYVYAAVHDGTNPELGTIRTAPSGRYPLCFTSFGDQATPTLGRRSRDQLPQRQPGVTGGRGHHRRHRTHCPALQPRQRRPVLREPRPRSHPHLVGLVRQQHPLRALPAMDAGGGKP